MMKFPTFVDYYKTMTLVENCIEKSDTVEDFFDKIEDEDLQLETVMTGDMAQVTLPLGDIARRENPTTVTETAPPSKKAEDFIVSLKKDFQKRYGDQWKPILYALSWKLYNKGSLK